MTQKNNFTVDALIDGENLLRVQNDFPTLTDVFEYILFHNRKALMAHSLVIGIDGSMTAGKTYSAQVIEDIILQHNIPCHTIHCDWFMSSREIRAQEIKKVRSPDYSFEDFNRIVCDFDKICKLLDSLSVFIESNSKGDFEYTIDPVYNRRTGESKGSLHDLIKNGSVVIVEGGGLLNAKLDRFFDISVRLDINSIDETIKRLCDRENGKDGQRLSSSFVTERYLQLDFYFDNYLRFRDRSYFDYLVDTTNASNLKLFARLEK